MLGQPVLGDSRAVVLPAAATETTLRLGQVVAPPTLSATPVDDDLHPGSSFEDAAESRIDLRPGHLHDDDPPRPLRFDGIGCAHHHASTASSG
jgi:hypothetical protein